MIDFFSDIIFSKEECDSILKLNDGFNTINNSKVEIAIPSKRKSKFGKVTNIELLESIILPKVSRFGILNLKNSQPMFIQYNVGDYFKPHTDVTYGSDSSTIRIYTLIIQLSDSDDYEGGTLRVENNYATRDRGTAIIFRSDKVHELTEVTSGSRNILVCMFSSKDLVLNKTSII